MKEIICHLQIAKAASNTTRALMQLNFPEPQMEIFKIRERSYDGKPITVTSDHPAVKDGLKHIIERQYDIKAISAMLPFGMHNLLARPVRYFTFVRDPVKRLLSAIHYVYARRDTHPAADDFASLNWRPSALISAGELLFINDQVRIISGSDRAVLDRRDLEQALENIKSHFVFVGNSAALPACWQRFCELTGLSGDGNRVLNRGTYLPELDIDEDEIAILKKANMLDYELVNWVNTCFLPGHGIHLTS